MNQALAHEASYPHAHVDPALNGGSETVLSLMALIIAAYVARALHGSWRRMSTKEKQTCKSAT